MKRILVTLAALASVAAAPAVAAESEAFGAFKTLCQAGDGKAAPALAAADAAGWAELPDMFMKELDSMNLKDGAGGRAMVVNRKLLMMLAGRGDMGSEGQADFCAVISVNRDTDQVVRDMRAMTGVDPAKDMPEDMKKYAVWTYIDGPKGREYVADPSSRKAMKAYAEGKLTMLMAGEDQSMTIIMQIRPDKAE